MGFCVTWPRTSHLNPSGRVKQRACLLNFDARTIWSEKNTKIRKSWLCIQHETCRVVGRFGFSRSDRNRHVAVGFVFFREREQGREGGEKYQQSSHTIYMKVILKDRSAKKAKFQGVSKKISLTPFLPLSFLFWWWSRQIFHKWPSRVHGTWHRSH